jgi:hypothetical protein
MMPRATRSKKIIIAEDDTDIATQIPLPDSPGKAPRFILQEISHNPEPETMTVEDAELAVQLKGLKAAYKTAIGGKKNKKGKGKKKDKEPLELIVVEDDEPAVVSPAVEGARQILSSDEGSLMFLLRGMKGVNLTEPEDLPSTRRERNASPTSPAVRATRQQLAKAKSGQFDDVFSLPAASTNGLAGKDGNFAAALNSPCHREFVEYWVLGCWMPPDRSKANILDQTVEKINGSRVVSKDGDVVNAMSPARAGNTTPVALNEAHGKGDTAAVKTDCAEEDSFVEQITTRSPAKLVSRIEDSVEALDKLEEVIEALDEATITKPSTGAMLTIIGEKSAAKVTAKPFASMRVKSQDTKRNVKTVAGSVTKVEKGVKRVKSSSALRDAVEVSEGKVVVAKRLVKRPSSLLPPKQPVRLVKPTTQSNFELPGEAVARRLKEQREARQAQREANEKSTSATAPATAPKVKSRKPSTMPTFELPGEALSRKKREALEARLKIQEEEERKRREFKAKPIRKSSAPDLVPRDTTASRARKSQGGLPENGITTTRQPSSSLGVGKRSSVVGAHRPSIQTATLANTSAPRSPGPAKPAQAPHARKVSMSGPAMSGRAMQRTVSAVEVQQQRQRAKEIYNRDTKTLEEMDKERKEREAAAKRARLQAAERGRQASREWAEKQRARKAAEGDKGMAPGFGPGGQMGLKP